MAEVAIPQELFQAILEGIQRLEVPYTTAGLTPAGRKSREGEVAGGSALSAFGRKSVLNAIEGQEVGTR